MHNVLTILRRELSAYFTSPVGYIFLAAFILFTNLLGLFIVQPWFEYPEPNLRMYFYVVLGVSAFFVAAITMRLWADERRGNTFEMLLTLPMRARELVLGKFLAGLAFYAIALALTLTVPFMVARVTQVAAGSPGADAVGFWGALDVGAVFTAYLGALLAGCLFLAFGLFISGLCQDQIVAFVLTAPTLFLAYLLGLAPIQGMLDSALDFLMPHGGRALGRMVGVFEHYENLVRGLVNVTDILFFLLWTGLFLFLNTLTLERRGRAGANATHAVAIALVFAIGGVANAGLLSELRLGRLDVTRDQVFTVHDVTRRVLGQLEDKVLLRYHVTPRDQLPAELQSTERDVVDKLDALRNASNGRLEYELIYRQEAAAAGEADPTSEGADDDAGLDVEAVRRVEPFQYASAGSDRTSVQLVYSGVEITYGAGKPEVLLPQVVNAAASLGGQRAADVAVLEFAVVDFVHRARRRRVPVIAVVAPLQEHPPALIQQFMQRFGQPPPPPDDPFQYIELVLTRLENYDVRRVRLTAHDPLPDDADLVIVAAPEKLNERQVYELSRALASGTPMFLAVQRQKMDYRLEMRAVRLPNGATGHAPVWRRQLTTFGDEFAKLLPPGAAVNPDMLMDRPERCFTHLLGQNAFGGTAWQAYGAWPMHVRLERDNLDLRLKYFENVNTLRWLWGATLDLDEKVLADAGIEAHVLARSGPTSWRKALAGTVVTDADLAPPASTAGRYPLIALLEGAFPFAHEDRPAWPVDYDAPPPPEDDEPFAPPAPAPGKLLLLADGFLWHRLGMDRGMPPELTFLMNSVAAFVLDDLELAIRDLRNSTFAPPSVGSLNAGQRRFWKTAQVGGHVLLIAVVGLAVWIHRSRRREAYQAAHRRA